MKREFLEALGLEKEAVDKILEATHVQKSVAGKGTV